jgi:hypothetical protein
VRGKPLAVVVTIAFTTIGAAQVPLAPVRASGQSVTPAFEGWYKNPDGSYSISFGYFNRNSKEILEIPIGADNNIAPGAENQGQPTSFQPRRHWGVFAVILPATVDPKSKVVWTLNNRGERYAISGSLNPLWEIDALQGEASDNTPPSLRFSETGAEGQGPAGITVGPLSATVNTPLPLSVWVRDDGRGVASIASSGRATTPTVALAFFKHQGPGDVAFTPATARVPAAGGSAATTATFTRPGEYILRVRANDSAVASAGHAQCCWTNGFIRVTVTP